MAITEDELRRAVENCDRHPIHIPGAIQGFGLLVAGDANFDRISHVSANVGPAFGMISEALIGAPTASMRPSRWTGSA